MFLRTFSLIHRGIARRTCTTTTAATGKIVDHFRTLEVDPENHSLDHEGKFYTIDSSTYDEIFKYGGFSGMFLDQLKILKEAAIMVRRPALEIIHYLRTADYSLPPIRYVLYSKYQGTGMTVSLAHIIHYAWLKKWLIVHCQRPFSWVRASHADHHVLSSYNPSRLDQNREAVGWLQYFKQQNSHLIDKILLSQSYTWSKRESSEKGETLTSVIDHGLERSTHATDCVNVVLKEVKLQSGPESFRTLVVVDGVNALFGDVKYRRPDGTKVQLDEMALLRGFKKLLTNDWSNAAVVTSADVFAQCQRPVRPRRPLKVVWPDKNPFVHTLIDTTIPLEKKYECYPRELLGPNGFSVLNPFVPVEVDKYNLKEFNSCFDYYVNQQYIVTPEGQSEEGRQELQFLSGCIPGDMMKYCAPL